MRRALLVACALLLGSAGCGDDETDPLADAITRAGTALCHFDDACFGDSDGQTAGECEAMGQETFAAHRAEIADPAACIACLDLVAQEFGGTDCTDEPNTPVVFAACDTDPAVDQDGSGLPDDDIDACGAAF